MLKKLRANNKGLLYVFLVLIISVVALVFLALLFSTMIQGVQEGTNPLLGVSTWVTPEHFNVFYMAATVVTNFWTYVFGIIILGLMYWAWIYTQRKGVGG